MKKFDHIWNSLTEFGTKNPEMIGKPNISITDSTNQTAYLIFSDVIVKKSGNIYIIKKDDENQFQNQIFKTVPKHFKHELFNLIK